MEETVTNLLKNPETEPGPQSKRQDGSKWLALRSSRPWRPRTCLWPSRLGRSSKKSTKHVRFSCPSPSAPPGPNHGKERRETDQQQSQRKMHLLFHCYRTDPGPQSKSELEGKETTLIRIWDWSFNMEQTIFFNTQNKTLSFCESDLAAMGFFFSQDFIRRQGRERQQIREDSSKQNGSFLPSINPIKKTLHGYMQN